MSDADDLLKNAVYNQEIIAERKAAAMVVYEERIIKKILLKIGKEKDAGKLAMRAKEKTGKARLTFEWLYEEYPNFPIYLRMRKVPFAFQVSVKDLFNKFCSTPMFKEWEEFHDEVPETSTPIGLVFDWPGVKGTQMIMHNCDGPLDFDNRARVMYTVKRGKHKELVTIEQFAPFFDELLEHIVLF